MLQIRSICLWLCFAWSEFSLLPALTRALLTANYCHIDLLLESGHRQKSRIGHCRTNTMTVNLISTIYCVVLRAPQHSVREMIKHTLMSAALQLQGSWFDPELRSLSSHVLLMVSSHLQFPLSTKKHAVGKFLWPNYPQVWTSLRTSLWTSVWMSVHGVRWTGQKQLLKTNKCWLMTS